MTIFEQVTARKVEAFLVAAVKLGYLPQEVQSACDFGAGLGGSTLGVKHAFQLQDSEMMALELHPACPEILDQNGILAKDRVIVGDGIQYLRETADAFDLITTFMFDPLISETDALAFLKASALAINPGGKLLIASDLGRRDWLQEVLGSAGICWEFLPGQPIPSTFIGQSALVIDGDSLKQNSSNLETPA